MVATLKSTVHKAELATLPAVDFHRTMAISSLDRRMAWLGTSEEGAARNRLPPPNSPSTFASQLGDMSHRALVGVAVCGEVPKVGNASDEAAITLAIDRCPVPDPIHSFPPC